MREVLTFLILSILMMIGAHNTEYSWYMLVAITVTGLLFVATCIKLVLKYHTPKPEEEE